MSYPNPMMFSQSPKGLQSLQPPPIGHHSLAQSRDGSAASESYAVWQVFPVPLLHGFWPAICLGLEMYRRPTQKGAPCKSCLSCSFWGGWHCVYQSPSPSAYLSLSLLHSPTQSLTCSPNHTVCRLPHHSAGAVTEVIKFNGLFPALFLLHLAGSH